MVKREIFAIKTGNSRHLWKKITGVAGINIIKKQKE